MIVALAALNRNSRKKAQKAQKKEEEKTHAKPQRRQGKTETRLIHRRSQRSRSTVRKPFTLFIFAPFASLREIFSRSSFCAFCAFLRLFRFSAPGASPPFTCHLSPLPSLAPTNEQALVPLPPQPSSARYRRSTLLNTRNASEFTSLLQTKLRRSTAFREANKR
jgi:hypothetical protein